MLSPKAQRNQRRSYYLITKDMKSKPVKKMECDENSQVFNWQRTYKKAAYKRFGQEDKLKQYRNDKRKQ